MNYAIFRTELIYKLSDLGQSGSHNKRKKEHDIRMKTMREDRKRHFIKS